jgi:tRNA modification GTPase
LWAERKPDDATPPRATGAADTIYAPATAPGPAPVAILRVSGPRAHTILEKIAGWPVPSERVMTLRRLRDPGSGAVLDEALVVAFHALRSATGEAMAELHVHGGPAVVSACGDVLEGLGARLAEPGEFSRRAFHNGKRDLVRLEAVARLIEAETDAQRQAAVRDLGGALSDRLAHWRAGILRLMALCEATLDFADEDVPDAVDAPVAMGAAALASEIEGALEGQRRAAVLYEGAEIALVGAVNAGKSTLINRLAGRDVALTSSAPGTTRDVIEARCVIGGAPVRVLDTAGDRVTDDPVEGAGVAWGRRRAAAATLVVRLHAHDAPAPEGRCDVMVWNKCDVVPAPVGFEGVAISALRGDGMERLETRLAEHLEVHAPADAAMVNRRQAAGLQRASAALRRASRSDGAELAAADLRTAAGALADVLGRIDEETVLDEVFGTFCIGK